MNPIMVYAKHIKQNSEILEAKNIQHNLYEYLKY